MNKEIWQDNKGEVPFRGEGKIVLREGKFQRKWHCWVGSAFKDTVVWKSKEKVDGTVNFTWPSAFMGLRWKVNLLNSPKTNLYKASSLGKMFGLYSLSLNLIQDI